MNSKVILLVIVLLVVAGALAAIRLNPGVSLLPGVSPSPQEQKNDITQEEKVMGVDINTLVEGGEVLGPQDAPVTIIEFSDPSCPYCAAAAGADIVAGQDEDGNDIHLISDYLKANDPQWQAPGPELEKLARAGKVRLVFRYYPGHGTGEEAMQAAWCAASQDKDKFWQYLQVIFANQPDIADLDKISGLATDLGLDSQLVKDCVGKGEFKDRLKADTKAAQDALKALGEKSFGTPAFLINDQLVIGAQSWSNIENIINSYL